MPRPVDDIGMQARLRPGALAVSDLTSDRRWTYAEFDQAVACCAGALDRRWSWERTSTTSVAAPTMANNSTQTR